MMRLFTIVLKDLKQIYQDKRTLIFLLLMPVAFTLFMGFAYGSNQGDENTTPRLALAWVNLDVDVNWQPLEVLKIKLSATDPLQLEDMNEATALNALHMGKVEGVLVIPKGFSQSVNGGDPLPLTLITAPSSSNGTWLYQIIRQPVIQWMSSLKIAELDMRDFQGNESAVEFEKAFQAAWERWEQTDNTARIQTEFATTATGETADPFGGNPYNQASPGILLMFAMFGLMNSAQVLLNERKNGTLARMLTISVRPPVAIAGHFLAMFTLTLSQQVLLVSFGQILLGVNYLRAPLGVIAVMVALSMATAGLGLLIGAIAREEQQATLYSLIMMFIFSGLGGAWFPLEVAGKTFTAIGQWTPTAWAMTGFQNILIRGQGLSSTILPCGILLGYAVVFCILAVWRLRRSME